MSSRRAGRNLSILVTAALGAVAVLLLDLSSELGISTATLYVPVVLLVSVTRSARQTKAAAALCSIMTLLGLAVSPTGGEPTKALTNRLFSLVAIVVVTCLADRHLRVLAQVEQRGDVLRETVDLLEQHKSLLRSRQHEQVRRARVMASVMEDLVHEGGKLAEQSAQRKRADRLVRLAVEAAPSGMLMADSQGRIVMVNSKIEEIFGYSRDALLGEPFEKLIPERYLESHPALFARFLDDSSVRAIGEGRDLTGQTSDGREVPIELGLTPVHADRGLHMLASVVDVSERERMISELRAKTTEMEQLLYVARTT